MEASHEATTATKCWALQFMAWRAGVERAGAGIVKRRGRRRRARCSRRGMILGRPKAGWFAQGGHALPIVAACGVCQGVGLSGQSMLLCELRQRTSRRRLRHCDGGARACSTPLCALTSIHSVPPNALHKHLHNTGMVVAMRAG